jgi:Asp-tRNA(Asn)/Glu-tRNA(Gln) amidotransferase A subunit family amidase
VVRTLRLAAAVVVSLGGVASGCSSGDDDARGCGPTTREALDPAYLVHVVGSADEVEYTSDPPTSGPHQPGPPVSGVLDEPLSRPVQVGILERGDVLIQHDPDLEPAAVAELEALAGDQVVVAPNPDLPHPIVATAWVFKRTCETVDAAALQEFVDDHVGKGPEG